MGQSSRSALLIHSALREVIMKRVLATVALGICVSTCQFPLVSAQVARQGTKGTPVADTIFTSPMVIDTRFVVTWRGKKDTYDVPEYHDLGKFTCDGVSLRSYNDSRRGIWKRGLTIVADRLKPNEPVKLKMYVAIHNPKHNHDKSVTVIFEIREGDQTVQTGMIGPLGVEEHGDMQETSGEVAFTVPADLLSKQPAPTLRLTVMAKDD